LFVFFFKQKTAYEIPLRLVGSEMCNKRQVFGLVIDGRQHNAPRHFIHQFAPRPNALRGDLEQCAERAMGAFVP